MHACTPPRRPCISKTSRRERCGRAGAAASARDDGMVRPCGGRAQIARRVPQRPHCPCLADRRPPRRRQGDARLSHGAFRARQSRSRCAGGSSSTSSRAFEACGYCSSSAVSTTQTRQPPSPAVEPKKLTVRRTSSTVITVRSVPVGPGVRSSTRRSVCDCAATRRAAGWSGATASERAACTAGAAGSGLAKTKRAMR